MEGKCKVDLTKADHYDGGVIPDEHVEIALRVLRTLRNLCLSPGNFDAEGAIVFSHAHAHIHDLVVAVQENEKADKVSSSISTNTEVEDAGSIMGDRP